MTTASAVKQRTTLAQPDEIKVGDKVRRGPDWCWKDQDGGNGEFGTVLSLPVEDWVQVKWDAVVGDNNYKWNKSKDVFEIEVIPHLKVGSRVKQGPEWDKWITHWGHLSKGSLGNYGTISGLPKDHTGDDASSKTKIPPFYGVVWDNGNINSFCYGKKNKKGVNKDKDGGFHIELLPESEDPKVIERKKNKEEEATAARAAAVAAAKKKADGSVIS